MFAAESDIVELGHVLVIDGQRDVLRAAAPAVGSANRASHPIAISFISRRGVPLGPRPFAHQERVGSPVQDIGKGPDLVRSDHALVG